MLIGALLHFTIGSGGEVDGFSSTKNHYDLSLYTAGHNHAVLGIVNSFASSNLQSQQVYCLSICYKLPVFLLLLKGISYSILGGVIGNVFFMCSSKLQVTGNNR